MRGFCLNPMPLGITIERKSKCYRRRKPGHLPGRSLVFPYFEQIRLTFCLSCTDDCEMMKMNLDEHQAAISWKALACVASPIRSTSYSDINGHTGRTCKRIIYLDYIHFVHIQPSSSTLTIHYTSHHLSKSGTQQLAVHTFMYQIKMKIQCMSCMQIYICVIANLFNDIDVHIKNSQRSRTCL